LKHLCREFDFEPKALRKFLRETLGKSKGRWQWPEGSKELEKIRALVKNHKKELSAPPTTRQPSD
ncbi:hypothetical protein ACI3RH_15300, partial [Lactococcus lactis]